MAPVPFSTGSCYEPVPKVSSPAGSSRAHVEAPLVPVRKKPVPKVGGFSTESLVPVSEPVLKALWNRY